MVNKIKLLLLPLHRWVSNRWGSELAWAFNLAQSLSESSSVEVTAVVGNIDEEDKRRLEHRMRIVSLGLGRLDSNRSSALLNHARFYFRLGKKGSQLMRELQPDVVHHVFPMGLGYGQNPHFLLFRGGPPRVIGPLLHPPFDEELSLTALSPAGLPSLGIMMRPILPLAHVSHQVTLRRASWLLYDSIETRNFTLKRMPRLASVPWTLLPTGGYDAPDVTPLPSGRGLKIGLLHYLRHRKRIHLLLQSIARNGTDVSVLIAGSGPAETGLRHRVSSLSLEGKVRFLGKVPFEQRNDFWSSVDLAVTLDRFPPLALSSIQEAMLAGRPFIAAGLGDSPFSELPFGIVLGPNLNADLDTAIETLASDREKLINMAKAARRFALDHFTRASVQTNLLDVYNSVLESHPGSDLRNR